MKNVVVEGCTLVANSGTGNISITSSASLNTKVDSKGVYAGTINISITGLSGTGFEGGTGTGTLTGTAQYSKIDGQPIVLEGDQSETINVTAAIVPTPASPPYTTNVPTIVTIQSANQTAMKAE